MAESTLCVAPLMKVGLLITMSSGDGQSSASTQARLEFIYGLGREGMTPIENALYGKAVGDLVSVDAEAGQLLLMFGHLYSDLQGAGDYQKAACRLVLQVTSLVQAAGREVVKALARSNEGCGDQCDCGCGC